MRQQQIMRAVAQKIEHDRLNTLTHLQQILAVVHKDVDTNFSTKEELAAAWPFSHLQVSDIHTAQVPYVDTVMLPDYGDSLIPDETAKRQLVAAYFPQEVDDSTAVASAATTATPIHVRVENGTATPGLAGRIAAQLRQKGFIVDDVSDAQSDTFVTTEIHVASANQDESLRVRDALGQNAAAANIIPADPSDMSGDSGVTIVLGRDILGSANL